MSRAVLVPSWRTVAFFAATGASAIHFGTVRAHLHEYVPAGAFMLISGVAQLVWGVWVARGAPRWVVRAGIDCNIAIVWLWVASRTTGLPYGMRPWMREDIHSTDLVATALELLTIVACFAMLREASRPARFFRVLAVSGLVLSALVTGHTPTHERFVATAALALILVARALIVIAEPMLAIRPIWREYERASFAFLARPRFVASARAGGSAR